MTNVTTQWGLCITCKWWQVEPDAAVEYTTMGQCIDERLQDVQLRVSGNSGCAFYTEGEPARGAGASAKPPAAAPAR